MKYQEGSTDRCEMIFIFSQENSLTFFLQSFQSWVGKTHLIPRKESFSKVGAHLRHLIISMTKTPNFYPQIMPLRLGVSFIHKKVIHRTKIAYDPCSLNYCCQKLADVPTTYLILSVRKYYDSQRVMSEPTRDVSKERMI